MKQLQTQKGTNPHLQNRHQSALRFLITSSLLMSMTIFSFGQSTILKNVTVIDVVNERILPNRSLEVKDGLISKIHDRKFVANEKDSVIDLTGKFAIPGLIDSHTHIEHSAYWTRESKWNPPRKNIIELLSHALHGGVTGIREMASDARVVGELSRLANINSIASPDIYYSSLLGGPQLFKNPKGDALTLGETAGTVSWARAIDNDTDLPRIIAEAKGNGSHALKLYAFLDAEQIRKIVQEAHAQDLKVWAHSYVYPTVPSKIIKGGVDALSHTYGLWYELTRGADSTAYPEDDLVLQDLFQEMKSRNISLDPTIFVAQRAFWSKDDNGKLAKIITKKAHQAGVRIIAGTDSISAYKQEKLPFVHQEIEHYVKDSGFSTIDALKTATINAAITLGVENEIGSVDEGKRANIIVLNKNPLDDIRNTRTIFFVMKDGIIYKE